MSNNETITIIINDEGNASIDLQNFHGRGCGNVMKDFTDGAGEIKTQRNKREFSEEAAADRQRAVSKG